MWPIRNTTKRSKMKMRNSAPLRKTTGTRSYALENPFLPAAPMTFFAMMPLNFFATPTRTPETRKKPWNSPNPCHTCAFQENFSYPQSKTARNAFGQSKEKFTRWFKFSTMTCAFQTPSSIRVKAPIPTKCRRGFGKNPSLCFTWYLKTAISAFSIHLWATRTRFLPSITQVSEKLGQRLTICKKPLSTPFGF